MSQSLQTENTSDVPNYLTTDKSDLPDIAYQADTGEADRIGAEGATPRNLSSDQRQLCPDSVEKVRCLVGLPLIHSV
jgi:hypothetical protein